MRCQITHCRISCPSRNCSTDRRSISNGPKPPRTLASVPPWSGWAIDLPHWLRYGKRGATTRQSKGRCRESVGGLVAPPAGNFVRSSCDLPSMTLRADGGQPGPLPNTHPNPRGLPIIVEFYVPRALRRDAAMRQPFVVRLYGQPKFALHIRGPSLPWTLRRRGRPADQPRKVPARRPRSWGRVGSGRLAGGKGMIFPIAVSIARSIARSGASVVCLRRSPPQSRPLC